MVVIAVVIAFVPVLAACDVMTGRPSTRVRQIEREPYAGEFMPSYLAGVSLGIDWPTLQRLRPEIMQGHERGVDTPAYDYFRDFADSAFINYAFSDSARPDTAFARPLPGGVLSVIEIDHAIRWADIAAYRRAVASTIARWNSVAGPADSVRRCWHPTSGGGWKALEIRVWNRRDVILMLGSVPDDELRVESAAEQPDTALAPDAPMPPVDRVMTMIVQSSRLQPGEGFADFLATITRCRDERPAPRSTSPRLPWP